MNNSTYSRLGVSQVVPSSSWMRYTLPNMTYSKESAREGITRAFCGAHSSDSGTPPILSVVARTKLNFVPKLIKF